MKKFLLLKNKRADYGKQIVVFMKRQLEEKYVRKFWRRTNCVVVDYTIKLDTYCRTFTIKNHFHSLVEEAKERVERRLLLENNIKLIVDDEEND